MRHFTDLCTESISLRDLWFWQPWYSSWTFNVNPISSDKRASKAWCLHVQASGLTFKSSAVVLFYLFFLLLLFTFCFTLLVNNISAVLDTALFKTKHKDLLLYCYTQLWRPLDSALAAILEPENAKAMATSHRQTCRLWGTQGIKERFVGIFICRSTYYYY